MRHLPLTQQRSMTRTAIHGWSMEATGAASGLFSSMRTTQEMSRTRMATSSLKTRTSTIRLQRGRRLKSQLTGMSSQTSKRPTSTTTPHSKCTTSSSIGVDAATVLIALTRSESAEAVASLVPILTRQAQTCSMLVVHLSYQWNQLVTRESSDPVTLASILEVSPVTMVETTSRSISMTDRTLA